LKFKAIDGQEDQGGGPVWRYEDADNYHICRANPLESNCGEIIPQRRYSTYSLYRGAKFSQNQRQWLCL